MACVMPMSGNASEVICGRDASRTDMHGRKLPESMLKNTWTVRQDNGLE